MKSIEEFHDIYFTRRGSQNTEKSLTDQPHKGLMVHVSSNNDDKMKPVKINFVDLAGFYFVKLSSEFRMILIHLMR